MIVGGAAAPRAMIEGFERAPRPPHHPRLGDDRDGADGHDLGALEPRAGACPEDEQFALPREAGPPVPLVEIRARGGEGLVPWDGATMGELEVRGPWISSSYYDAPEASDRWTDDGWFKTGDIVTIEPNGYVEIQDRSKDLVKSGGEWISTVGARERADGPPGRARGGGDRGAGREVVERPLAVVVLPRGPDGRRGRAARVPRAAASRSGGCPSGSSSSTRSRRRPSASSARLRSGSSSHSCEGRPPPSSDNRGGSLGTFVTHRARGRRRARHDRQPAA